MSIFLPFDVIENILSRLPVKSLVRFKSVSKLWQTTISDRQFARFHLQQSKNSGSQYLLVLPPYKGKDSHVVKLENQEFQIISVIQSPWSYKGVLCYCDGLQLKYYYNNFKKTYVLWNPSSRLYKEFTCPHPIRQGYRAVYGLCYDPLINDYKVIITDMNHYTIFYCSRNYWSDMKEMEQLLCCELRNGRGVCFNDEFYWIMMAAQRKEGDRSRLRWVTEIICFNSTTENFRKIAMPQHDEDIFTIGLKVFGGHLYLALNTYLTHPTNRILLMKKVDHQDSWIKIDEHLPFSAFIVDPIILTSKNEILLEDQEFFIFYNLNTKISTKVSKSARSIKFSPFFMYEENLFLSSVSEM